MTQLCKLLALLIAAPVHAILPLQIQNHRFIKARSARNDPDENEIFFVKGIDYQPGGSSGFDAQGTQDVLTDPSVCSRDIFVLQQMGVNTIRIYQLNPNLNHDKCMTMLNNAGIYVILDVNSGNFGEHLNRADPKGSYNAQYLNRVFRLIEAFKNYPNVLGFFSGNEVINDENNYAEIDPPYLRALQRDMKRYLAKHSNRAIPVGYSAADNTALRLATFKYLQCNSLDGYSLSPELQDSCSDFYGLNSYQWCSGSSDWQSSGYGQLVSTFSNASIPLIFSEYGCNKNTPRSFTEVSQGLYKGLADVFSGGLIYEFSEEANSYGVVYINDNDGTIQYKQDLENLAEQYNKLELPRTKQSQLATPSLVKCDSEEIDAIFAGFGTKDFWIPPQSEEVANMIENGVEHASPGSILTDYLAPNTSEYEVKNVKGSPLRAVLTWDIHNTINSFDKPVPSKSFAYNLTRKSISSQNSATSSFLQTSKSMPTTRDKHVSSTNPGSTAKNYTTLNKSNGKAARLQTSSGLFAALAAILLSFS